MKNLPATLLEFALARHSLTSAAEATFLRNILEFHIISKNKNQMKIG